jgi:hypothetical protein
MKRAITVAVGGAAVLLLLAYVVAGAVVLVQSACEPAKIWRKGS